MHRSSFWIVRGYNEAHVLFFAEGKAKEWRMTMNARTSPLTRTPMYFFICLERARIGSYSP
jgi:hypothetical protein